MKAQFIRGAARALSGAAVIRSRLCRCGRLMLRWMAIALFVVAFLFEALAELICENPWDN